MAATLPDNIMKKCVTCGKIVNKYSEELITYMENHFEHIENIKSFLFKHGNCENCAWVTIKSHNNKKQKQNQKVPLVSHGIYSKYITLWCTPYIKRILLAILFGLILAFFVDWSYQKWAQKSYVTNSEVNIDKLKSTIKGVQEKFPSLQQSLLKKINGGILRLKSPGEPFILMLLHDNTNKQTTDCLASYTSFVAKQNIFTTTTESLWLNGSEWSRYSDNVDNQKLLYEKLLTPLKKNEVLVLENFQDMPWSLASCFHHLCDAENPHIAKAMYIIELKVDDDNLQQLNESQKLLVAERAMIASWEDAPNSFRSALIARLTSFVDTAFIILNNECPEIQTPFIRITP